MNIRKLSTFLKSKELNFTPLSLHRATIPKRMPISMIWSTSRITVISLTYRLKSSNSKYRWLRLRMIITPKLNNWIRSITKKSNPKSNMKNQLKTITAGMLPSLSRLTSPRLTACRDNLLLRRRWAMKLTRPNWKNLIKKKSLELVKLFNKFVNFNQIIKMKLKKCNGRKERWKRDMKMKLKELLPDMRNRLKPTRSDMTV